MKDPRHGDECSTELEGEAPGGFKGKIRGFRIADLILAVVVVWALAVKPYLDSERDRARDAAIAKEHSTIAEAQEKIAVAFTEFAYIITLEQDRRSALNLSMPQSLREKIYSEPRRAR